MKHARFCEIASQFPCFCNTQKIPESISGLLFCTHPDGFRETTCFSLFCQDRSQSEIDQDDHTEDDAVVSEEFEVMFLTYPSKNWIEYMETTKAITMAAAMKKSSIAENARP